ncbi:hypothetical protein TorRG33x02_033010, partial [Trema orientale]
LRCAWTLRALGHMDSSNVQCAHPLDHEIPNTRENGGIQVRTTVNLTFYSLGVLGSILDDIYIRYQYMDIYHLSKSLGLASGYVKLQSEYSFGDA